MNLCHYPHFDDEDDDEYDPDALAEYAASRVGLDGLDVRDPLVFLRLLVPAIQVLPRGDLAGCFDPETCVVRVDFMGGPWAIKTRLIHELGHVILWVNGIDGPHCESLCDRAGRAGVLGRGPMLHRLARMTVDQVVLEYAGTMLPCEIRARAWEAWQWQRRLVG